MMVRPLKVNASGGAPSMSKGATDLASVTTVGPGIASQALKVACFSRSMPSTGRVLAAKAIKRKDVLSFFAGLPPCLVGLKACGTAHHWGWEPARHALCRGA
jgi:transposase